MLLVVKDAVSGVEKVKSANGQVVYNTKTGKNIVSFKEDDIGSELIAGQYYKVQIAYKNDVDGYYSSAGIIKKTEMPTLSIPSL
jgi:hypothetical protein